MLVIQIDKSVKISNLADIQDSDKGTRLIIGKETFIDSFVRIKPVGGIGDIVIGERCFINSGTVIFSGNGVKIGNDVLIAPNCTLVPTGHKFESEDVVIRNQGFSKNRGGIVIESNVWIGANCVILDGTFIPSGSVIGANSLVNAHLPSKGVYFGNPAVLKNLL